MLCFSFEYKGKKICVPAFRLIPYPWHIPTPVGPDDYRPQPDAVTKALGLSEELLRTVTGLSLVDYGIALLPQAQQTALRDTLARNVVEVQHAGVQIELSK